MTLDIRGSLKNTKVSSNRYVVFEELLSNSIDSFLIRQHTQPSALDLTVTVDVRLFASDLLGEELDVAITCSDNGCGLGPEQIDAFLTKDTSYKDDLAIAGIGRCKGSGRIQFFHHFSRVGLHSTYRTDTGIMREALKSQHPDTPKRLGQVMSEVNAVPIVRMSAMQQVGFEAEFDGDGGVISRPGDDAVIVCPNHGVEAASITGEG